MFTHIGFQTQMWVDTLQSLDIYFWCFSIANHRKQNPWVVEHACGLSVLNPTKMLWLQKFPDLQWTLNPQPLISQQHSCLHLDFRWLLFTSKRIQSGCTSVLFYVTSFFSKSCTFGWWIIVLCCLFVLCRFVLVGWVVEEGSKSERLQGFQGAGKFGKAN